MNIDLEYYKTVARTQKNNPDILRAELLDLIGEIENDPIYKSIMLLMKGEE